MRELTAIAQLAFTIVAGMYFFIHLRADSRTERDMRGEYQAEAEYINSLRRIHLNEPTCEFARPKTTDEIVGQEEGIRALRAALWGENPQHIIIYGPPGVGKTAAARIIMDEVKKTPNTPFSKNAPFIEADATIMRSDERGFADPLIGSVHDPIYQGATALGQMGIPQPKLGAVTRAHGGVLFLDEIGELPNEQINKLLKVLEDRRVMLESSYYSSNNKKNPAYIRDIFENGLPADFRLIGATTAMPKTIPEAIRSRCVEVYFKKLTKNDLLKIVNNAVWHCGVAMEEGAKEKIAQYTENGRNAIKILEMSLNLARMEGRGVVTAEDVCWTLKATRNSQYAKTCKEQDKIIDISMIKPFGKF